MNSRERVLTTLDHREPDRIPFDLGSVQVTGIHEIAYRNLHQALGLPETAVNLCDTIQQLATIEDDLAEQMGIDFRGLYPLNSHNWGIKYSIFIYTINIKIIIFFLITIKHIYFSYIVNSFVIHPYTW